MTFPPRSCTGKNKYDQEIKPEELQTLSVTKDIWNIFDRMNIFMIMIIQKLASLPHDCG